MVKPHIKGRQKKEGKAGAGPLDDLIGANEAQPGRPPEC